jgi:DNA-binding NarL/FixJ family response regulator
VSRVRVVIAEDHGVVRAGLHALLDTMPRVEVVGEAGDGNEALALLAKLRPDVLLLDVSMPGLGGIEAARRAQRAHPQTRVLFLSMHSDREYVRQALGAGAAGYLLKSADRAELELALSAAARGGVWLSPGVAATVVDDAMRGRDTTPVLTPRQSEILQLIALGQSTKEIASHLKLSAKTVESHRAQIMERLDIRHVAGLVRYAIRVGLVAPEV